MTVLVTGANGFLGQALVRALLAGGRRVRALVRERSDASALEGGVEIVRGDATDPAALRRAVPGCSLVYHLAGVRRAADRESFLSVNAGSTRLLLEACLEAGAARQRFVLAGSLASIGPSREGRREDDPYAPAEWYGESKAEAERICLSFTGRLPVAIGRPPRIIGPGDRENLFFFRIVAKGVVLRILGPERPLSWIDVDDCARGLLALADHPAATGEVFFLASQAQTSVVGLQESIALALGVRARRVPVPPAALRSAATLAEAFGRITGKKLPITKKLVRQILAPGWVCDPGKARERLGFVAETPLADSVARAAAWYRTKGLL